MAKVAIVYFSGTGTTRGVAQAVQEGVESAGAHCVVHEIVGADITEGRWSNDAIFASLDDSDAIIFGTPTYMGSVAGQMKTFMDAVASRWYTKAWDNKLGAAFTASALAGGDKQNSLFTLVTFAMQMCMRWVGTGANPAEGLNMNGFYLGVGVSASKAEDIDPAERKTAVHLGARVVAAI